MRYLVTALLSLVVLAGCAGSGPAWRVLPPGPEARSGAAGAALSGRVAVAGGLTAAGEPSARVDLYDPRRRRWIRLTDLPEGLDQAMVASRGGRLYVVGGYHATDTGLEASARAWVLFDRRWHPLPDLPEPRAAGAAAIVRNRIYVVGGQRAYGVGGLAADSLHLDLRTLRWTGFAGVKPARSDLGATALGGRIYAVGGRTAGPGTNVTAAAVYDPVTRAWTALPDAPTRRGGGAAAAAGRLVIAAGGDGPNGTLAPVDAFDPDKGEWRTLPRSPRPRTGAAVVGVGRVVYQALGAPAAGDPPSPALLSLRVPPD